MSLLSTALRRDTLRQASTHLAIGLGLLLIGALALLYALWDRGEQTAARDAAQADLGNLQAERDELQASLDLLNANLDQYRTLQRAGFIGPGDRIAWTEALLRVRQRLALPDVAFELAPQEMLEPPFVDPGLEGLDSAGPPPAQGPLAHDLRFQASGLHEGEWLALLEGLAAERVGLFRPERCQLQRDPQRDGLDVDCTLRWITYLPRPRQTEADAGDQP